MKISDIGAILDDAMAVNLNPKRKEYINPLFISHAGIGKTKECEQWARSKGLEYIDLRVSYFENPDFIGKLKEDENGRTTHSTPDFWPSIGDKPGLLVLEELNTGSKAIHGALLQLLNERRVHKHIIPSNWTICGCINPDGHEYDVVPIGTALDSRFSKYQIDFDMVSFADWCEAQNYHLHILSFLNSGLWNYQTPEKAAKQDQDYISPRSFSKLNELLQIRKDVQYGQKQSFIMEQHIFSHLGSHVGADFINHVLNIRPVLARHLLEDYKDSIDRLRSMTIGAYKGEMVAITMRSLLEEFQEGRLKLGWLDQCISDAHIPSDIFKTWLVKLGHIYVAKKMNKVEDHSKIAQEIISQFPKSQKQYGEIKAIVV